jgi:hypothetical protein
MKRSRRVAGVALAWLSQCAMTGTGLRAFTSGCAVKIPATAGLSWRQPGDISPTAFDSSAVFSPSPLRRSIEQGLIFVCCCTSASEGRAGRMLGKLAR